MLTNYRKKIPQEFNFINALGSLFISTCAIYVVIIMDNMFLYNSNNPKTDLIFYQLTFFLLYIGHFSMHSYKLNSMVFIKKIHSGIERLVVLVPLSMFMTYMIISHFNVLINTSYYTYENPLLLRDITKFIILISTGIVSTFIIVIVPYIIKTITRWRYNHGFAIRSGLLFHFNDINQLLKSRSFNQTIINLGEIHTIKYLGITGFNSFVSEKAYLKDIFLDEHLALSCNPNIKILLSEIASEGLKKRAKNIKEDIDTMNNEIIKTLNFLNKNDLNDLIEIEHYKFEPKFKLVVIDGKNKKLALIQAYLNNKDITKEQIYIYYETDGASMYKMINKMFDEIYTQVLSMKVNTEKTSA